MNQNILTIPVSAEIEPEQENSAAGSMYEHNATALRFLPDAALLRPELRYYLEFVTASGVSRTEYLQPDAQNAIVFPLPVEITSRMTALCIFNAVQVSENGDTQQLIKAKTVRLHFSPLQNTERQIAAEYDFSVNALLQAIKNGSFQGEKGEKGDAYVLQEADKAEIAAKVDAAFYGLPLQKQQGGCGTVSPSFANADSRLHALVVSPATVGVPLTECKLTVGENLIADLLDSKRYSTFTDVSSNYAYIQLQLKPNTEYLLSKLHERPAVRATSMIINNGVSYCFCHATLAPENHKELRFTTSSTGLVTLRSTGIYQTEATFARILENDWIGLTLTEAAASVAVWQSFDEPLYRVDETLFDCVDVVRGQITRKTFCAPLSADCLCEETPLVLQLDGANVYRYKLQLPTAAPVKTAGLSKGYCSVFPTMTSLPKTNEEFAQYFAETGNREGIFFGTPEQSVYVYSTKAREAFVQVLAAETPLTVIYAQAQTATARTPVAVPMPKTGQHLYVSPKTAHASLFYDADVSATVADFESRIAALENTI